MPERTFTLPDLGEGLTEAQLVAWRVEPGAVIDINAPLCEVETAKAVVVIPSPWAGTVRSLHGKPGETIPVGAPLVTIEATGEAAPAAPPEEGGALLVGYGTNAPGPGEIRRRPRATTSAPVGGDGPRAAPFVRQLARDLGVDLATIEGSGPGGRVTRADVEAAASARPGPAAAPATPAADGDQRISVVGIRKAIARQMVRSVSTIPQFTEFALFDATRLAEARALIRRDGRPLTPLPFFIRATVQAARAHPLLNSSWDEARDEIVVRKAMHVGIAVNTPNGLLVPVLKNADQLSLEAIAEQAAHLIEGARAGSLPPGAMTGSTITVTNVGASGPIETGTPIINPPECCVVGFGGIRPRPMVVDGQVQARPSAWISISVDHRIVDGALATEFLTSLVGHLEHPA